MLPVMQPFSIMSLIFRRTCEELCEAFVAERIDYVAGDAFEGYNPMHDVCRLVINAAVTIATRIKRAREMSAPGEF